MFTFVEDGWWEEVWEKFPHGQFKISKETFLKVFFPNINAEINLREQKFKKNKLFSVNYNSSFVFIFSWHIVLHYISNYDNTVALKIHRQQHSLTEIVTESESELLNWSPRGKLRELHKNERRSFCNVFVLVFASTLLNCNDTACDRWHTLFIRYTCKI